MSAHVVGGVSWDSGGLVSNHVVPLPSGVQVGERLIVIVSFYLNSLPPIPAGWNLLFSKINSTCVLAVLWKDADGSETEVAFESYPGNPKKVGSSGVSYRVVDFDATVAPESGTAVGGNTNAPNAPALSPSWGAVDTLFFAVFGWRPAVTGFVGYPAGFDDNQLTAGFANSQAAAVASASKNSSVGSENPGAASLAAVASTVSNTIAIKSA